MITIAMLANPLRPSERQIVQVPAPLVLSDWLVEWFPGGVRGTLTVIVDGMPIPVPEIEGMTLRDGAHVVLVITPAMEYIGAYIINALIAMAISVAINAIFKPRKPTALVDQPAASPVYSISGSQNAARVGEPIPVGYGEFIQVPDFASQPYTEFENNEQYLNEILVIGQGEYQVLEMLVGDSTITSLQPGIVQWDVFAPAAHGQAIGNIEAATGIMENVVTSPEVGDQELNRGQLEYVPPAHYWRVVGVVGGTDIPTPPSGYTEQTAEWLLTHPDEPTGAAYYYTVLGTGGGETEFTTYTYNIVVSSVFPGSTPYPSGSLVPPGTWELPSSDENSIGWFEVCKPGQIGDLIMLDFVFPGGLYAADTSTGALGNRTVEVLIEMQEVDGTGAPISAAIEETASFTAATNTQQRHTLAYEVDPARYRVRCTRITTDANASHIVDKVVWTGLKFRVALTSSGIVYGNTTLVAVRIKASNGIASAATSRIRFRVQRLLRALGEGPLIATRNPADMFVDILTAPYGAARPLSEIDMPALAACRTAWAAHNGFNGVIAQRSTVFEALNLALQVVAAGPLPLGGLMSVQVDTVKDTRVAMFTEANVSNLVIGYEFDKVGDPAGVRVEFRRPDSFAADFVTLPAYETDVEAVSLFGCTDQTTAQQYAQLILNRRTLMRKSIAFDTEQEGLIVLPGDRIAFQHSMPRWGQVAIVKDASGAPLLVLDRPLPWASTPEPHGVLLSNEYNGVSASLACERGAADHELVLLDAAPFALFGQLDGQEPTRVAFGTVDSIVRDWIVTAATPQQGLAVHIEALVYNPDVYDGAMPHQGGEALPLPPPPGGWMIAGTPLALSPDWTIAGTPEDASADYVLPGAPDAPVIWLEDVPP